MEGSLEIWSAEISLDNAVLFWNDDIGRTRDLLSFNSFKILIKWLKTKANISYENDHSGESNSTKSLKTYRRKKNETKTRRKIPCGNSSKRQRCSKGILKDISTWCCSGIRHLVKKSHRQSKIKCFHKDMAMIINIGKQGLQ